MNKEAIAIIGCGNLGLSIAKGLIDAPAATGQKLILTKRNPDSLRHMEKPGIIVTSDNVKAVRESSIIIVAVKPYKIASILEEIKTALDPEKHLLISTATGISIAQIKAMLQLPLPLFRAMPNTATDVKESVTMVCHSDAGREAVDTVYDLFNRIGLSIAIEEELMEAATVLGACGIAFVMRFIRAMTQGGIQIGFDADTAGRIVNQVTKGAAELLMKREQHPEHEIDKVTTPKGCTIVGLNEMEHHGFSSSLIKGIVASYSKIENRG